jgi:hypothetical protein
MDHLSAFFSGGVNPFWPQTLLLGASVLASFAVAAGIVIEAEKRWSLTTALVVGGVTVEALCTFLLFAFDEGISNAQQARIAPRSFTKEQYDAIQMVKGKVHAANVMVESAMEPNLFSPMIVNALIQAGVSVTFYPPAPGDLWTGTMICLPKSEGGAAATGHPLVEAFRAAGLNPATCLLDARVVPAPKDVPLIMIGERFPTFTTFPYFGPPVSAEPTKGTEQAH